MDVPPTHVVNITIELLLTIVIYPSRVTGRKDDGTGTLQQVEEAKVRPITRYSEDEVTAKARRRQLLAV